MSNRNRRITGLTLVAVMSITLGTTAQMPKQVYVGISRSKLNYIKANQEKSQWCWAACIEMVMRYHGLNISQEEIVRRSYGVPPGGKLPDFPGSERTISANLNGWGFDANGKRYVVSSFYGVGAPPPLVLLDNLQRQMPVILAYRTRKGGGHTVVGTAASYIPTAAGPIVQSVIIRDPMPNPVNPEGRVEVRGIELATAMTGYWLVDVRVQRRH